MIKKPQLYLTKVFIQIFLRNKQYIFFSLLLPVVILGIVGLNDGERDPVDIGLVDYSNSNISKEFIDKLSNNVLFNINQSDEESLRNKLIKGELTLILVLPNDMEDTSKTTNIKLLADKSQINFIEAIKPIINQTLIGVEREISKKIPMFSLSLIHISEPTRPY